MESILPGEHDLQGLLDQFQPTEADRKRARQQALMAASLSLLGRPKGAEYQSFGQAGLLGMGLYNNQLAGIPQQRLEALKAATGVQEMMLKQRALQQDTAAQQEVADFYRNHQPGVGTSQPAVAATTGGAMPKQSLFDQYTALSQALASKGFVTQAQKYADMAEKVRPKIKEQRTLTQNGKRVQVNVYDDGSYQILPDVEPDLEPAHFSDNGAMTGIPQDKFTGKVLGAGIVKSLTPDAMLSSETARRGQDITDARAREALAQQRATEGRPQIVTDGNGNMFSVDPRAATGRPIVGPDSQPLVKAQKPSIEYQKQTTGIANLNTAIEEYKQALKDWSITDQINPAARAKMGTVYNNMMLQAKEAYNLGVLNGPDYMILQQVVTNPLSATGAVTPNSAMLKQVDKLSEIMQKNAANAARMHNQPTPNISGKGSASDIRSQADAILSGR